MCQMCDEYENELVRMGLIEDAKAFREEREREHEEAKASVARRRGAEPDEIAHHVQVQYSGAKPN